MRLRDSKGPIGHLSGLLLRGLSISLALLLLCGFCLGGPRASLGAEPLTVVINEVAWMGTAASAYDEWIELYNITDQAIDLTGWKLVAADGTPNITLTGTIFAKGYFLLERTGNDTVSDILADQIYGNDGPTWALKNEGEALALKDPSDKVIDIANGNGGPWPAGTAAGGTPPYATMERLEPLAPDSDENWVTNDGIDRNGLDADGKPINGTPKAPNSPFNKPPSCKDINVTTNEDTPVEIDLAPECTDPDRDPLTGSFLSDPPHGTAQFLSPIIRYAPDGNFYGNDSFTFRVSDGKLESNTATVNITIHEVNDNPIAEAGPDRAVIVGTAVQLDGSGSGDPDGDPLSYNWAFISKPAGSAAALSDPNIVNPTFMADVVGDYILELTVDDGRGGTDSDQVVITAKEGEGDPNGDGKIDLQDAILAAKFALGLLAPTLAQAEAADVVQPCEIIDVRDVVRIAEVALGIKDEGIFTCGGLSGEGKGLSLRMAARSRPQGVKEVQLHIADRQLIPGGRATIEIFSSTILEGLQVGPEGGLSFDPKVVQIEAIRGVPPFQVLAQEIDNELGRAKFMAIAMEGPSGSEARHEVVELEVKAVGQGGESTIITLLPDMALDAEGDELKAKAVQTRLMIGRPLPLRVERALSLPNPVRGGEVRFTVMGQGIKDIKVQIYDLSGREVFSSGWIAGETFEWNLMEGQGRPVANGIYLYTIAVRGFGRDEMVQSGVKRLVVLK